MVSQAAPWDVLVPRSPATVPIALIAGARLRARRRGASAQWQVPRDCAALPGIFMVPSRHFGRDRPWGTVTRGSTVSFMCPNS